MNNDYFSFAERDYSVWLSVTQEFLEYPENEEDSGFICWNASNIAERYLKHCYVLLFKNSKEDKDTYDNILHSHNLYKICRQINKIDPEFLQVVDLNSISRLSNYYFNSIYPGDDSTDTDYDDAQFCYNMVKQIRQKTIELNGSSEQKQQGE